MLRLTEGEALNPMGHQPGVHVPGTTVPIPYAMGLMGGGSNPVAHQVPTEAEVAAEAAAVQRAKVRQEGLQRRREEWITHLLGLADPYERLLATMAAFTFIDGSQGTDATRVLYDPDALARLHPEWWASARVDLVNSPPWNSREVASWFAGRMGRGSATQTCLVEHERRLLPTRRVTRPGWHLDEGSTLCPRGERFSDVSICEDGSIVYGVSPEPRVPGEGLNAVALSALGFITSLTPDNGPCACAEIPKASGTRPYDEYALMRMTAHLAHESERHPFRSTCTAQSVRY